LPSDVAFDALWSHLPYASYLLDLALPITQRRRQCTIPPGDFLLCAIEH
jgi:hypothetical protein